jgi:predicted acylesterase/phospholipase RssA
MEDPMSADPHGATDTAESTNPASADAADIPVGEAARALPPCDVVMKGGVASGLVYPGVVKELARRYRFASIGGTSAGAIAAGICAAAEFGRQRGTSGGIGQLDRAVSDLRRPGFLLGMFQPTREAKPLFDVLKSQISRGDSMRGKIGRALVRATLLRPVVLGAGILGLASLAALAVAAWRTFPVIVAVALTLVAVLLAALVVATTGVASLGLLVRRGLRTLEGCDYGLCPGTQQDGRAEMALVDWLHDQIQCCAGKPLDDPLTFGDLKEAGIELTMMTTDLGFARPVRVPDDLGPYLFDPVELRKRFPDSVVDAMLPPEARADPREATLARYLPTDDLPVLVGVRLSLSFPILLSAMPLYIASPTTEPQVRRHLFSDGGIASNFPLHFFDAWVPGRPTFGIDLADHPGGGEENVFMPEDPTEALAPRWQQIGSVRSFLGTIFNTMQNWRDTLQGELPGFRDRICQIRFLPGQGGLYLEMDHDDVESLIERGHEAGRLILDRFDEPRWNQHRWIRYLTLMDQLQDNLQRANEPFEAYAPELDAGAPDVTVYRDGRDGAWCERARGATAGLVALGATWGPDPLQVDFRGPGGPEPVPIMRVVPRA